MGMLDDLLAAATGGQALGGQELGGPGPASGRSSNARGGGVSTSALVALLPIVLALLANRGGSQGGASSSGGGGLGDILGEVLGGAGSTPRGAGGGLGDILGQVLGGAGSAPHGAGGGLGDILGQVLGAGAGAAGGLGGLLQQLERGGFGDQARSWVGTGANHAIAPDAMSQVFGADGLAAIARHAGLSEGETASGLAQLLPEVVDRVTPQGRLPEGDELAGNLQDLLRRFGS
jgi:uncharacterized protein YidB (DUF937 family)